MSEQEQIVQGYRTAEAKMTAMLAHAQLAQWDAVVSLGEQYLVEIERLTELEQETTVVAAEEERKQNLIHKIRSSESHLRDVLESTMSELRESTAEFERQRDLRAYYSIV